jgi:hypothetical protein
VKLYEESILEYKKLEKQLDQECDTNAALEDQLKALQEELLKPTGPHVSLDEYKVLQEKLALCDEYYQKADKKLKAIVLILSGKEE